MRVGSLRERKKKALALCDGLPEATGMGFCLLRLRRALMCTTSYRAAEGLGPWWAIRVVSGNFNPNARVV